MGMLKMARSNFGNFLLFFILGLSLALYLSSQKEEKVLSEHIQINRYWFVLHRKSNIEKLYKGVPGDIVQSSLIKTFAVKTGVPREKPTPLPELLGREYWLIVDKAESKDNPETAPYFFTLNIPVSEEEPFGPVPYFECKDVSTGQASQCNWILPGAFGLHGVNGDLQRLSEENAGSSGCIRHKDEDITYLYNLLDPQNEEIRYYVKDI